MLRDDLLLLLCANISRVNTNLTSNPDTASILTVRKYDSTVDGDCTQMQTDKRRTACIVPLRFLLVWSLHAQLINMYCLGCSSLKRTFFFFLMKSTSSGGGGWGRAIFGKLEDCEGRGILSRGGLEEESCGLSSACFTEDMADSEDILEEGTLAVTAT